MQSPVDSGRSFVPDFMHALDFLAALHTPSQVDREDLELSINVPDLREAVDSAAEKRLPGWPQL